MMPAPVPTFEPSSPANPHGLGALLALAQGREQALPLREVRVRADLVGDCARVVVEQRFANPLSEPMEVVHLFPVPLEAAVTELELVCGDLVVRAECRERQEAEATFAEARQAGHRASLLTRERDDVHTLRVTRLPPGEEVRVRLVLVQRLECVDGRFEWRFPTVLAPRYTPGAPLGHEGPGTQPDTDRVPDASRIQPPLALAGGARLDLEVALHGPVRALESSLHALRVDLDGVVRVAPAATATVDRDFCLRYSGAGAALGARAWTDGRHTLVVVEPPAGYGAQAMPRDAVFVIDISGSMSGEKLAAAQRALIAALHGLMPGDRFQLLAFDDRLERFAADFTAYDDRSLARADRWIAGLHARGGTEMAPALAAALQGATPPGRLRTVLFITDGQATNEAELLTLVGTQLGGARLFTFGIDTAVNAALMKKLARAGGGTAELAAPGDDIEAAVARLEARFGSPVLSQLEVPGANTAWPLPQVVFTGRAAGLLIEHGGGELTVTGQHAQGGWSARVQPERAAFPLGALWARERVQYLEHRLLMRPFEEHVTLPELRRVALEFGIASRATAFVAVERTRVVGGGLREVVQPHPLPAGWDAEAWGGQPLRSSRSRAGFAPPPPAPMAAPMPGGGGPGGGVPGGGGPSAPMPASPKRAQKERFEANLDELRAPMSDTPDLALADSSVLVYAPMTSAPEPESAKASPAGGLLGALRRRVGGRAQAEPIEPRADSPPRVPTDAELAVLQGADGSYGGDVERTAAALLALLLQGNTRGAGLRRRTVVKAAAWLGGQGSHPAARLALEALDRAERGEAPAPTPGWAALAAGQPEGAALRALLAARGV